MGIGSTMRLFSLKSTLRTTFGRRNRRLASGLLLGLFLLMHFCNIGLGLISLDAMDAAEPWLMAPWRSPAGTVLLLAVLGSHLGLALQALYARRTLKLSRRESAQLGLGLLVPFLLASHVVATRVVPAWTEHGLDFSAEVRALWVTSPLKGLQQVIVLIVAWTHACLGLWFWLRTKRWFGPASPYLLILAILLPVLALLGFAEAGKQVAARPPPEGAPALNGLDPFELTLWIYAFFGLAIAGVFAGRQYRHWRGRNTRIRVTYPNGLVVVVPKGSSVLEASRLAGVPHASMCGGRGRCSTCRVRVLAGLYLQPPPSAQESATLARFRARPEVRLACQLRPTHDLSVFPVFASARALPANPGDHVPAAASHEQELAILFCDLRGFTRRAEQALPFDTVFLLNRYFEVVGEAVEEAGGYLDKFIGDGALALFGLDAAPTLACRQALSAAAGIARGLAELNAHLSAGVAEPLRIAMGLHAGSAIVGQMGYGAAVSLTAIGDGINVASRLEGAAKEFDAEAVVSLDLVGKAGLDLSAYPQQQITVRGRQAPIGAVLIHQALSLASLVPAKTQDRERATAGEGPPP